MKLEVAREFVDVSWCQVLEVRLGDERCFRLRVHCGNGNLLVFIHRKQQVVAELMAPLESCGRPNCSALCGGQSSSLPLGNFPGAQSMEMCPAFSRICGMGATMSIF
jgi:hypothetical protein